MFFLLLVLFSLCLSSIAGMAFVLLQRLRRAAHEARGSEGVCGGCFVLWPGCWLAVRTRDTWAVQRALELRQAKPCSWLEGLAGEGEIFVTPPIQGWTLVTGTALPEPWEDVDAFFRFVVDLSQKLGVVQFFGASRLSLHHAWVKTDKGRVVRAYAWAGKTLWNQGAKTAAERDLGLRCDGYGDGPPMSPAAHHRAVAVNVQRVPLLAACWGFDPRWIDERSLKNQSGVVGELSHRWSKIFNRSRHV